MHTRVKQKPQIRDLIADDARCVALEGFRIYPIGREIAKVEYLKVSDAVVDSIRPSLHW